MEETHSSYKKILGMTILAIIGVVIVALLMLSRTQKEQLAVEVTGQQVDNTQSAPLIAGAASLTLLSTSPQASLGDEIKLTLTGNTLEAIVGYDGVITFDPTVVSYVSTTSTNDNFQIVATPERGKVIITGTKKLAGATTTMLEQASLATATFKVVGNGQAVFGLEYASGKTNDSNIINTQSKDILESATGTTVTVE